MHYDSNSFLPSPEDIRAARAYLDWSQKQLGAKCGLTGTGIANIEKRRYRATETNLKKIQKVFWEAAIEFTPGGGFRPRDNFLTVYRGNDSKLKLQDDIFYTLKDSLGEVLIYGVDERKCNNADKMHIARIINAGIKEKILLKHGDTFLLAPPDFYRWAAQEIFSPMPFFIYANKVAFLIKGIDKKIIIIDDEQFAEVFKKQFMFIWNQSQPISGEIV